VRRFYKVVTPDLASFHDPTFVYEIGKTKRPGTAKRDWYQIQTADVLHASATAPGAARWGDWPYRLVAAEGNPVCEEDGKYGFRQLKIVEELDVALCFGPNGHAVVDVLETLGAATPGQMQQLAASMAAAWAAAWDAAWDAAWAAARDASRAAAWAAARDASRAAARDASRAAARDAAWDAAWAAARAAARDASGDTSMAALVADLVGRYGLKQHHIETLMAPYIEVFGRPTWMEE